MSKFASRGISVQAFLGGRLVVYGPLSEANVTVREFSDNLERFDSFLSRIAPSLRKFSAKMAIEPQSPRTAKVNLDETLELLGPAEIDYLRSQFKWGRKISLESRWWGGAEPFGVPTYFTGMGGPLMKTGIMCRDRTNPKKLSSWTAKNDAISWAELYADREFTIVRKWVNVKGMTVRKFKKLVEDFARRVQALELW